MTRNKKKRNAKHNPKHDYLQLEMTTNMAQSLRMLAMAYMYKNPDDTEVQELFEAAAPVIPKWGTFRPRVGRKIRLKVYGEHVEPLKRLFEFSRDEIPTINCEFSYAFNNSLHELNELNILELLAAGV